MNTQSSSSLRQMLSYLLEQLVTFEAEASV